MAKIGRPNKIKNSIKATILFDVEEYRMVKEIAELESYHRGKPIAIADLVRDAVNFVYRDGERLRECFRRSRAGSAMKWKRKYCP